MAKNTSISLGAHFDEFITQQLQSGRYGSATEVVRTGLRMLEEAEIRRQYLRRMLVEGEQSGFVDYDYSALMEELDKELPGVQSPECSFRCGTKSLI
ncbi:MAG: type II toxin-antitoxin system ParD family antitoxin [Pseudohongiella sp.]|nr:type II toxin-antitoxin system ParD family antitoxin [Pseudohongiella sp.]